MSPEAEATARRSLPEYITAANEVQMQLIDIQILPQSFLLPEAWPPSFVIVPHGVCEQRSKEEGGGGVCVCVCLCVCVCGGGGGQRLNTVGEPDRCKLKETLPVPPEGGGGVSPRRVAAAGCAVKVFRGKRRRSERRAQESGTRLRVTPPPSAILSSLRASERWPRRGREPNNRASPALTRVWHV